MEQATLSGARANHASVMDAVEGGLWRLGNDELLALARTSMMTQAQSQAAHLSVVAEIEARGVAASVGALDTKNLLRTKLNITPSLAAEQARLAAAFAAGAADTGQALAEGRIHYEQATTIVRILGALPTKATVEDHAFAQKVLLEAAEKVDAKRLRKLKRSLHDGIDPDGPEPTETRKACTAHVRDNGDGTETLTWTDTVDAMAMLRAVIERHYAPVQGEPDETPCTPGQRRAAALREAIALVLRTGQLPKRRGQRPHLNVTLTAATLKGEPGAPPATTSGGQVLTPAQVQRIACDADVTPIILNGKGVPLWVGRKYRTVTPGQWTALVVRDGGCVFPQCDRPPDLCEAHHLIPWLPDLGPTDLDNLALFCFGHHDVAHEQGWHARMGPDGHPEVIPPPWVDPQQRPRRNEYWRIQRQLTLGIDLPRP
ncbi:MAG TPA: DUF222 domain-containing protein [Sporichthyaceae bacterium]|nr:DUF222 domain-containing protein [Sporichthyaceae bacterium]